MQAAYGTPLPEESDAQIALAGAMRRLAQLRARGRDWSDGPASLLTWANRDGEDAWGELLAAAPAPEPALELRGRFESVAPVVIEAPTDAVDDELSVALAFAEDRLVAEERAPEVFTPMSVVDEPEDLDRRSLNLGAVAGIFAHLDRLEPTAPPPEEPEPALSFGSVADIAGLLAPIAPPDRPAPLPVIADAVASEPLLAVGACADIDLLIAMACDVSPVSIESPVAVMTSADDDTPIFAVGAFALNFVDATAPEAAALPRATNASEPASEEVMFAFGATAALAALIDATPPEEAALVTVRPFDPDSLIDDALADAFDALLASDAVDPTDIAWDVAALPDPDNDTAALTACEAALWNLPRHVPCSEIFQFNPNHEIAVKLTRTLRLRAHALEARAFAENADFGFLQSEHDAAALWFLANALSDTTSLSAGDAEVDVSLPDWRVSDEGLIVVTAPDLVPPRAEPPVQLITEEELDALFARVDQSRQVVLDDLNEEPRWAEPYWSDVDSYLAHVAETMDPALLDAPHPFQETDLEIHDLDIRDPEPEAPIAATHFWMPGDDAELAIAGEGDDLFIVGASEDAASVLVEDGATWSMRTGGSARMDEVVVSLSADAWSDIDAMSWRRIATLSGVADVRVEQNARGTRRTVVTGSFFATGLYEERVRLVRSGDDGEEDFPVMRPMSADMALFAEMH